MFLGQVHSPANPFQGSSFSSYGLKPVGTVVAFSVGDQAGDDSYVTRDTAGSLPTFTIDNGIITFSCPQTHSYVGAGDKVSWSGGYVYLVRKISTRQWTVRDADGSIPANQPLTSITTIDKTFSTLSAAIHGTSSGAKTLIGSADLVDERIVLEIPCYEKASNNSGSIDIDGWTTDVGHYVKIFAPNDVATECNKSQRHSHTLGGFFINSNAVSTLIECSSDNVWIDGLSLEEDGACNVGIEMQGSGIVSNCIIKGFATHGINVIETSDDVYLTSNLLYNGAGLGMAPKASSKVVGNTVYGYDIAIQFTAAGPNNYCADCLCANSTTRDFDNNPALYGCASDDATAGTINGCVCSTNTTRGITKFYDTSAEDFRITNANDPRKIRTGVDLRTTSPYLLTHDCAGNPNDDTPSMGAFHLVPSVPTAIGDTSTDIKTGSPNISISDGVITFDTAQTNDLLAAGCELLPGNITLLEKLTTTQWRGTLDTGLAPADDAGPTAVTSIKPKYASVSAASPPSSNLITSDIAWKVICVEKTGSSDTVVNFTTFDSDETRDIQIYAPLNGSECNSRRRHSGLWDNTIMHIEQIVVNDIGYVTILGLQIGTDVSLDGINAYNEMSRIEACLIKECKAGIRVRPAYNTSSSMLMVNNAIYDCDDEGIKLENTSTGYLSRFGVYNNTVYNCLYGISFDGINGTNTNVIRLVNNVCISNQKDIVGDAPRGPNVSSESNWTSDVSGFALHTERNNDIYKSVIFAGRRNFHIPLAQHLRMAGAYAACADHFFQITIDFDSTDRPTDTQWSIGADQYSIITKKIAHFSVGLETGDLQNDPGISVSVSGSIATFAEALDANIGIGDKVTMSSHVMYLAEKGSSSIWRVVDETGDSVSDFTDTLTDIKRVSNSLYDAFNADVYNELGLASKDITTNQVEVNVECYQDGSAADSTAVIISGWTPSATYPIIIEAPFDIITQCGRRQRHLGVWSNNHYHLDVNGDAITISDPHVYIDGLQIDSTNNKAVAFSTADECKVERCVIRDSSYSVYQDASGYDIRVNANIIYGVSTVGIEIQQGTCNNNTVIGELGTLYNSAAGVVLTNNIAQGAGTNFSATGTRVSCISEDSTATGTNCKVSAELDFEDTVNWDFHLARDDFEALNYGAADSNNPTRDIDSEEIIEYSIGADCEDFDTVDQYLSCGKNAGSFVAGTVYVTIDGGIATFTADIDNENVMIGDKLTYDTDDKIAYLLRKISSNSWAVVNHVGQNPTAVSAKIVKSIKRTFTDINVLFDPTNANSIAQFYGDSTNKFVSLAKGKMSIHIAIGGEAPFDDPANIPDYDCDSENHFYLFAPYLSSHGNSRHKHSGVYDADPNTFYSALLWDSAAADTAMITIASAYTEINGLVISGIKALSGKSCVEINAAGCRVLNNIMFECKYGVDSNPASNNLGIVANNIIYDSHKGGIRTSYKDYIFNNTIVDAVIYGIEDTTTSFIINNIMQSCTTACLFLGGTADYCITDDGTAGGTGNITDTLSFVAPGSDNYNLAIGDPRGKGFQLSGHPGYAFSTDAIENERGRFWDMGALEYQPTKVLFLSVGDSTGHYTPSPSGQLKITVVNSYGTFNTIQTSEKLVSGDKLVTTSLSLYLGEKVSNSVWKVTTADGSDVPDNIYTITDVTRAITAIDNLTSDILLHIGTNDLVNSQAQVNITIPDDSNTGGTSGTTVYVVSDVDYFLRIFAPIDTDKHCNVSQRHKGRSSAGATLSTSLTDYVIDLYQCDFAEVSGIIIKNSKINSCGIQVRRCLSFLVDSNIFQDCEGGGIICESDYLASTGYESVIVNNLIYDCRDYGISIEGDYANIVWALNNTIVNCGKGIYHIKEATNGVIVKAYNNICQDNIYADFLEGHIENTGKFILQYNISKDETAGIANHNFNNTPIEFVDRSVGNFVLDPDTDSEAIDSAYDMQLLSPYYYDTDMRGIERLSLFWDRGSLERVENVGSGSMLLGPLRMSNTIGLVTDTAPTTILYLRTAGNEYESVADYLQFNSIAELNVYLNINDIDNIVIYVEGGESFEGVFALNDRGTRTVTIQTDPGEIEDKGPASIVYVASLVDDASVQASVTFKNLKVYSDDAQTSSYLITDSALTTKMIFINCILQVNLNSLVNTATCRIEIINTAVLYFNGSAQSIMYLVKNSLTGHINFNSIFLVEETGDIEFKTCAGTLSDYVNNALSFNISTGTFNISVPGRELLCLEDTDPVLTEIETNWGSSNVSDVIEQSNFLPEFESPLINAGNNGTTWQGYEIETDIIGKDRVFEFENVDIGPYEVEVHVMDICGADIRSIDQSKLEIDRINERIATLNSDAVYSDLYEYMKYHPDVMEEFVREEKIAIELKDSDNEYALKTDKVNPLLAEFEAYYDASTKTILVTKLGGELPWILGQMLEDDSYILRFDEQVHKLYLYQNEVVSMGICGLRNPIKSVRFGGNPVFNG